MCVSEDDSSLAQRESSLQAELDQERQRYQNLLKEFSRLEQRYENLKEEVSLAKVSPRQPGGTARVTARCPAALRLAAVLVRLSECPCPKYHLASVCQDSRFNDY